MKSMFCKMNDMKQFSKMWICNISIVKPVENVKSIPTNWFFFHNKFIYCKTFKSQNASEIEMLTILKSVSWQNK